MINIFFYEFLNFRTISAGVIAFENAKIANIDRALENEQLAQKAWFSFLYTDTPICNKVVIEKSKKQKAKGKKPNRN